MLVSHQFSSIRQVAVLIGKAKGNIIFWLKMQAGTLQVGRFQQGKAIILFDGVCNQCIKGAVGPFKDQFIYDIVGSDHALVANTDIRFHHTVRLVVIRCAAASGYFQRQKVFPILLIRAQHKLR